MEPEGEIRVAASTGAELQWVVEQQVLEPRAAALRAVRRTTHRSAASRSDV
jgi:hypothetical protein